MPATQRNLHRRFFLSRQLPDGGFAGREGGSDLYYTAFALRGLALLGEGDSLVAIRAGNYLRQQSLNAISTIDLLSHLFATKLLESWAGIRVFPEGPAGWPEQAAATLEQLRRPDGGYAKSAEGHASSTYQTFLVALAYQLLETPLPNPQQAVQFLLRQQRPDGGFVEIGVMRRSGINPTAAAIGALRTLQPQLGQALLPRQASKQIVRFLLNAKTDEGGFRANTQIPIADLLSTYTALQTLRDLDSWRQVDADAALKYVHSLQQPDGGFRAALWDDVADVEYSFYGIASLGLLETGG